MKYVDEFRDRSLVAELSKKIRQISKTPVTIMEVCGGHTMAIRRFGIHTLLPPTIRLLSGPGCPVCVTSRNYIDRCVAMARLPQVIITTYGDLIRVPGSSSTLAEEKAGGADIRIVYSVLEAIEIAKANPDKKIIFPAIGFETTTPSSAVAIKEAAKLGLHNFFLYSAHKIMPPAMSALIDEGVKIDGYIGPGHVTAVAGTAMYKKLMVKHKISVVISGFEPVDLLQSVYMLVRQIENGEHKIEIQYRRVVTDRGNTKAQTLVNEVFVPRDDWWRGLGVLKKSGLGLRPVFSAFDAEKQVQVDVEPTIEPKGCICGEVLKGTKLPVDCKLFGKVCTPANPVGACMVSGEGACQSYYSYRG
ncbi:MAG: hydrogenase formation protein HypD [Bacteroidales bacterium]|nr:hydrogenase formation protein HypD [Bacteroidales bacterium]